jgi:hypothetical protein
VCGSGDDGRQIDSRIESSIRDATRKRNNICWDWDCDCGVVLSPSHAALYAELVLLENGGDRELVN